jgi:tripartite motif-containing protein 9/67
MLHSIRLIHPIGQLKEFKDHNLSVSEVNLLSLSQLLLIAQTTFFWDPAKKGKAINLSNNNCTANK